MRPDLGKRCDFHNEWAQRDSNPFRSSLRVATSALGNRDAATRPDPLGIRQDARPWGTHNVRSVIRSTSVRARQIVARTQRPRTAAGCIVYADLHAEYECQDRREHPRRTQTSCGRVGDDCRQHGCSGRSCAAPESHRSTAAERTQRRRDVMARCRARVTSSASTWANLQDEKPDTSTRPSSSPLNAFSTPNQP